MLKEVSMITVNPEIFARILFSQTALKEYCKVKNSRLGHYLPLPVNDRVILPLFEDFIFTKLRIGEVSQK